MRTFVCAQRHIEYYCSAAMPLTAPRGHWVRSPLLNIRRACQGCHKLPEGEIKARVDQVQQRNFDLMQRGGVAVTALMDAVLAAKKDGATDAQLAAALELQRKAQWRLDFIAAEHPMGFHAPQEAARVLRLRGDDEMHLTPPAARRGHRASPAAPAGGPPRPGPPR